jgi:hypothetical protein
MKLCVVFLPGIELLFGFIGDAPFNNISLFSFNYVLLKPLVPARSVQAGLRGFTKHFFYISTNLSLLQSLASTQSILQHRYKLLLFPL